MAVSRSTSLLVLSTTEDGIGASIFINYRMRVYCTQRRLPRCLFTLVPSRMTLPRLFPSSWWRHSFPRAGRLGIGGSSRASVCQSACVRAPPCGRDDASSHYLHIFVAIDAAIIKSNEKVQRDIID